MSAMDQIADLLIRIKNASRARHRYVDVNWSVLNQNIVEVMKEAHFVEHFLVKQENGKGTLRVFLSYTKDRSPIIRGIRKVSNPGRRMYVGYREIPNVFNGLGISIVSTSQGVLAGQEAKKRKVGGELLCCVW